MYILENQIFTKIKLNCNLSNLENVNSRNNTIFEIIAALLVLRPLLQNGSDRIDAISGNANSIEPRYGKVGSTYFFQVLT